MTPDERFDVHQRWLIDHDVAIARADKSIAEIHGVLAEVGAIQRQQAAIVLEIAQRVDALILTVERFLGR